MSQNPQIKFQPDPITREGLEAIATFHALGYNSSAEHGSANELTKIVMQRFAMVPPPKFWLAMAALDPFVSPNRNRLKRANYRRIRPQ